MTAPTRDCPSPRYLELLDQYKRMHAEGFEREVDGVVETIPAEEAYQGQQLLQHLRTIRDLVGKHGATSLLDYGCGKGQQYRSVQLRDKNGKTGSVQEFLGLDTILLYDPAVPDFDRLPAEPVDGVVCTDVLEHCPEADLPWIVEELFTHASKFVFAVVACYPARAHLPTGENAHETVRPPEWWQSLFGEIGGRYPGVATVVLCETGSHTDLD